jgi:flagellar basal body-associated protein FliL
MNKFVTMSLWSIVILAILVLIALKFTVLDTKEQSLSKAFNLQPGKISIESADPNEVSLDGIVIHIRSDEYKILKADFGLKMKSAKDQKALKENMPAVRNTILQHISSTDATNIHTPKGKEALKKELIELLEEKFGYKIETFFFKNFVLAPRDEGGI